MSDKTAQSDFSSPEAPSAEEMAAKHEKVFGPGSADVIGAEDPNWRANAQADAATAAAAEFTDEELANVVAEPEFTDDQRDRFLESIVDEVPFMETYDLLGGKMKVRLRTRTTPESIEIVEQSSSEGEGDLLVVFQMKLSRLHLAFALVDIEYANGDMHQFDVGTLEERLERLSKFSYPKYRILEEAMRKFDTLVDFFSKKAAEPDFWPTADGS